MKPDRRVPVVPLVAVAVCAVLLHSHIEAPMGWTAGLLVAVYATLVLRGLVRQRRFVRSLRSLAWDGELAGTPVRWVHGVAPFVAGIARPRIYCDPQMRATLTASQQRAVILHEHYHQRRRDPFRLVLDGALEPFAAVSRTLAEHLHAREVAREVAADRYAIRNGASRADVAGALVAILDLDGAALAPGFTSALEARVHALAHQAPPAVVSRWTRLAMYVVTFSLIPLCIVWF